MNTKQLRIVGIVVAALVLLYLLFGRDEGFTSRAEAPGIHLSFEGAVTQVDIRADGSDSTTRIRARPGGWTIDGFMADQASIDDVLEEFPFSATDLQSHNPANHARLGVADDGRRVTFRTDDGAESAFLLGNAVRRGSGYYARLPESDEVYRMDSRLGGPLARARDDWRQRTITRVDTSLVGSVTLVRDGRTVVLSRSPDGGWLADGAVPDTEVAAAIGRSVGQLTTVFASGFPGDKVAAAADFAGATRSADVRDMNGDGQLLLLRLMREDPEATSGEWLVLVGEGAVASEVFELRDLEVNRIFPASLFPEETPDS
ncbi:MAG: DUF4340 domain-containing protein [Gemmatimonadetes bacterium]|nr:DUF4340 domain-containing protein [Gemmatimonadota bacterium]